MEMDTKYGRVTTSEKDIPKDEPVFILRGQDILAPTVVRLYADLVGLIGCGPTMSRTELRMLATRMEQWQPRKVPD